MSFFAALVLARAQAAVPAAPPASGPATGSKAVPARAKGNLAMLIRDGDYPAAALRAGEQGIVGFRLEVDREGRVTSCTIVSSSGSAALDAGTCRIMTARARFFPARDARGKPTTDTVASRIGWKQ